MEKNKDVNLNDKNIKVIYNTSAYKKSMSAKADPLIMSKENKISEQIKRFYR